MAVTPTSFAQSLLKVIGAPQTPQNVASLTSWEAEEGGNWKNTAHFNPLNTTQKEPGSGMTGTQGDIGVYQNWGQGLKATADTLNNGDYGDILGALKTGKGLHGNLPGLKTWSGGGYSSIESAGASPVPSNGSLIDPSQPIANAPPKIQAQVLKASAPNMKQLAVQAFLAHPNNPLPGLLSQIEAHPTLAAGSVTTPDGVFASSAATARKQIGTTSKPPSGDEFNTVLSAAKDIAAHKYNYEWGGGHNSTFTPTTGTGHGSGSGVGYDCSGALSAVFQAAGKLSQPLVASQFAQAPKYIKGAKPGVGGKDSITIYANAEHTFSKIGNQYFGTSYSNPGGGAGFFKNAQTAGYNVFHVDL